ncbi:hypothetical protein [Kocuria marina]|uniref:hypothetical protein n=1 Tax=Kocuria marina TaxID=223184 RepID=UPI0016434B25|nr:hypothetical protein [Kocuria indica]
MSTGRSRSSWSSRLTRATCWPVSTVATSSTPISRAVAVVLVHPGYRAALVAASREAIPPGSTLPAPRTSAGTYARDVMTTSRKDASPPAIPSPAITSRGACGVHHARG